MGRYSIAILSIISFLVLTFISITGCAKKQEEVRIVATINDYKMTVEDFDYESKEIFKISRMLGEVPVTKEDIIDTLIVKELLLQEAQKENLDKDRDFMKTIELYWEQALLKNLLTKKSKEIEKKITVYEDEVVKYYNKMKTKIKAKVLIFADEKSAHRLLGFDGDVAEHAQSQSEKLSLSYIVPSKWYVLGEDNSALGNSIFNIDSNKDREIVEIDRKWALIIIEERAHNELGPLSELRDEIVRRLRAVKETELMNKWIDKLRSKAHIEIDRKVLKEL